MSEQDICCVPSCSNTASTKPNLSFFSIPIDKRRNQWLRLIWREDLRKVTPLSKSHKVCEEHFSHDSIWIKNKKKYLRRKTVPSLYLPSQEADIEIKNEAVSSHSTTLFAAKLTQTDIHCENDIGISNDKDTFYELCDTYLSKDLAALIKANEGFKYKYFNSDTDQFLKVCFNLYQTSPQAYQFFQDVYGLPKCDMLLKQFVQMGTKVNDSVMLTMKARVDKMTAKEKNCSMLIKTVKLKKNLCYNIKEDKIYGLQEINGTQYTGPTTMALVVMIRGLFSNWKQPLSYILVHPNENKGSIQCWMDTLIKSLFDIGLNLRTLVSSTKDDCINAIMFERSVSAETPFFLVDDKKIYHIFDAPDLIRCARDCMLLHDFHFLDKVATYEDIVKFYNVDRTRTLPYAHKLTERHISPGKKEKEEVKYAIQLLSRTVANGLWNYINFELINSASIGTVEFISNINNLFDILNISQQNCDDTERKRAFCENENPEDIREIVSFFHNLKVINTKNGQDITQSVKFVKSISITLNAISLLFNDIKSEGNSVLLTKNLHQEPLDNYINKMTSCVKRKPKILTALQLTVAFRKLFLIDLKIFTQRGSSNGEMKYFIALTSQLEEEIAKKKSNKEYLYKDCNISMQSLIKISKPRSARENVEKLVKQDYDKIDTSEKHSLLYICGYLLMKTKQFHNPCHILRHYMYSFVYEPHLDVGSFQRYNQYKQNTRRDLPAAPCDGFIQFVEEMDAKFVKAFTSTHMCQRIAGSLYKDIEEVNLTTPPCPCFPKKYVVELFIRIRIFYTIRLNNMLFKTDSQSRKYITVPKL